jgi:hypothetical protein
MESNYNLKLLIAIFIVIMILPLIAIYSIGANYNVALSLLCLGILLAALVIDIKKGVIFYIIISYFLPVISSIVYYLQGKGGERDVLSSMPYWAPLIFVFIFIGLVLLRKEHVITNKLDKWVTIYIIVNILYVFINQDGIIYGIYGARLDLFPMVMYFMARRYFQGKEDIEGLLNIIMICSIIDMGYGLFQYIAGVPAFATVRLEDTEIVDTWKKGYRISNFGFLEGFEKLWSASGGSYHLFYPITFFAIILLNVKNIYMGKIFIVLKYIFLIMFFLLLCTGTERTPIAMLFIGIAISRLSLSSFKELYRTSWKCLATFGGFLIIVVMISSVFSSADNYKMYRFSQLANPFSADTVKGREEVNWANALEYIKENPLIGLGLGAGSSLGMREDLRKVATLVAPHNMYLLIAMDMGVVGLLIFIILVVNIFIFIGRTEQYVSNTMSAGLLRGMQGGIMAVLASGMTNIPLQYHVGIFFWFFIGLIPLLPKIEYRNQEIKACHG